MNAVLRTLLNLGLSKIAASVRGGGKVLLKSLPQSKVGQ